jgi:hypothetical protein
VIVRRRSARLLVDVREDLEAEFGVVVQDVQPLRRAVRAVRGDEIRLLQKALEQGADFLAPRGARVAPERGAAVVDESLQVVGRGIPASDE